MELCYNVKVKRRTETSINDMIEKVWIPGWEGTMKEKKQRFSFGSFQNSYQETTYFWAYPVSPLNP